MRALGCKIDGTCSQSFAVEARSASHSLSKIEGDKNGFDVNATCVFR